MVVTCSFFRLFSDRQFQVSVEDEVCLPCSSQHIGNIGEAKSLELSDDDNKLLRPKLRTAASSKVGRPGRQEDMKEFDVDLSDASSSTSARACTGQEGGSAPSLYIPR